MTLNAESHLDALQAHLSTGDALIRRVGSDSEYCHDATEFSAQPLAVVLARTKEDVRATILFCHEHGIPICPRGAGTGLSGGCVPEGGALVLSTKFLTDLTVEPNQKVAVCGPGVITKHLMDEAGKYGLTFAPDPASYEECSLGGNIAENAGGLRCKRFGVTRDYTIGLEAVLADGSILKTGVLNNYRGFSIGEALVGSEGTLAIVTEIVVQLIDAPDEGVCILATFEHTADAARTVSELTTAGIVPTVLEFIDGDAAACANEYERTEGIDRAGAVLLIETSDRDSEKQTTMIRKFCNRNKATLLREETDPDKVSLLWKVRRNVSKAVKELAKNRVSEDVAVPNSKIPEIVEFISNLNHTSKLRINCWGHAGDGNIHVNLMSMNGTPEELEQFEPTIERTLKKVIGLGGTITGEHGVGLAKKHFLEWEFDSATLAAMTKLKQVFDPSLLLNPGKIFTDHILSK